MGVEATDVKVRLPFLIPGIVLFLIGLLWALQGASIVNSGFMAGQRLWLVIRVLVALARLGLRHLGLSGRTRGARVEGWGGSGRPHRRAPPAGDRRGPPPILPP